MKKKVFFIIILICLPIIIFLWLDDRINSYHNLKADDTISKAIYEEFGDNLYYQGRNKGVSGQWRYSYILKVESSKILKEMLLVVNDILEKECITDKNSISLGTEMPGGLEFIVILSNYSNIDLECADYKKLQKLTISGADELVFNDSVFFYNNPQIYTDLPDIKYLIIRDTIQEEAEAQGIDWYECWPDLETFEVYTRGEE